MIHIIIRMTIRISYMCSVSTIERHSTKEKVIFGPFMFCDDRERERKKGT